MDWLQIIENTTFPIACVLALGVYCKTLMNQVFRVIDKTNAAINALSNKIDKMKGDE